MQKQESVPMESEEGTMESQRRRKGRLMRSMVQLFETGMLKPNTVVRYVDKSGNILLLGKIDEKGITVAGQEERGLVSLTEFEAIAGGRYKRPAENIVLPDGKTLKEMLLKNDKRVDLKEKENLAQELLQDENDDFCVLCGLGVRFLLDCCMCVLSLLWYLSNRG